ncbi:hypothetical protein [Demequina sediminicola]|uniref:hypothetical protein n=1 Tax=Demequina sediminicola TaxID=1095026 RepID=UPI000783FD3A|nr:hypothetical protein [Demequina sediminicola]
MKFAIRIATIVVCIILGGIATLWAVSAVPAFGALTSTQESQDTQIVNAVSRNSEVALVTLGIEGISESRAESKVFGVDIPGSERVTFIRYGFNAKLGIDGDKVEVTPTGENSYTISIPEFSFIGHDDITFELAAEDNGVLSWVTAEVDQLDIVNDVLDDEKQLAHVESNTEMLKEQAQSFYEGIILSINPEIELDFTFAEPASGEATVG